MMLLLALGLELLARPPSAPLAVDAMEGRPSQPPPPSRPVTIAELASITALQQARLSVIAAGKRQRGTQALLLVAPMTFAKSGSSTTAAHSPVEPPPTAARLQARARTQALKGPRAQLPFPTV